MVGDGKTRYDIFICYRRDSGAETAKHLRDILVEKGYRVFFDTDSLRSGNFNTALLDVIANCKDFIIVLFPVALDRCKNEDDWVRQELACALRNGKRVIPIMGRGFKFPDNLPADIEDVRWKNGIDVNIEYFDAMIKKLLEFLESKPRGCRRPTALVATAAALVIAAAALCFFVFGGGLDRSHGTGGEEEGPPIESTAEEDANPDDRTDMPNTTDEADQDSDETAQGEVTDQSYGAEYYILPESDTRYYTKEELDALSD